MAMKNVQQRVVIPARPATSPRVLGFDLGFIQTKASWGPSEGERVKFSSLVKRRSEAAMVGIEDSEGFIVHDGERMWNVGAKGSYDFTADRMSRDSDQPKALAAFGLYTQKTAHSFLDMVVTGLPVDDFNAYRADFAASLQKTFHYGFGSGKYSMLVKNVLVIPQGAGSYYAFVLTPEGTLSSSPYLREDILSLDIGGRTSDACIMEKAKYSQDSFSIYHGVWKIQNELRRLIAKDKRYRYTMHPYEVDAVLRSRVLTLGGTPEDVSELCDIAIETHYPSIRDELSLHLPDMRRFSAVLLSGGGGEPLAPYLEADLRTHIDLLPYAEFGNSEGYRRYAVMKASAGQ